MNKKNQIIAVVAVLIIGFVVFVYFKNSSSDTSGSSIVAEQKVTEFAGAREILNLLNRMSGVKLDDSIFNDNGFKSLKDTTVVLVPEPFGRINPFAPFGEDGLSSTSSQKVKTGSMPFGGGVAPRR